MKNFWIIKTLYKSINLHPLYLIVCFVSIITGMFKSIYIFSLLIFVHEIGHALSGIILGWDLLSINIYPYGGCTKFNNELNVGMNKELLVLISGPLMQILFYSLIKNHISYNDLILFKKYNYLILFFNLLPIYPLDGGRLLNIFMCNFIPYRRSLYISVYFSFLICSIAIYKCSSISFFIVLIFIISNINKEREKISFYYNKFILERFIKNYSFKKARIIDCIGNLYRGKKHIIKNNNKYFLEKDYLKMLFENKCKNKCKDV